jgi:hypothetical protein
LSNDVKNAVYDDSLGENYKNDPQEKQIIDMIIDSRVYDFGQAYTAQSPELWLKQTINSGSTNFSTFYNHWRTNKEHFNDAIVEAYRRFGITFEGIPDNAV